MTMFLCGETPYLRILDPDTGEFIRFAGGRLDLDAGTPEGDHWLPIVTAEMARNATIRAVESVIYCDVCGESFIGRTAAATLARHREQNHLTAYLADIDAEHAQRKNFLIAGSAGFPCTAGCPAGTATFGSPEELAIHTRALHANRPSLDAEGNTVGGERDGGPTVASPDTGRRGPRSNGSAPVVKVPKAEGPGAKQEADDGAVDDVRPDGGADGDADGADGDPAGDGAGEA